MKKTISLVALMLAATLTNAQTTATNWTAPDCNSVNHTLFSELDSGKIIVFTWVMPCSSCKNGAKAAYDAVQSFASSHPGMVRCYIADDLGDKGCPGLSSWITSNSVGSLSNLTIFSNAGNLIKETDFGGTGMPHVVVMGGPAHKIFFNKKNAATNDPAGITAAINSAISATLGATEVTAKATFSIVPNPAKERITISNSKAIEHVTVTNVSGQVVKNESFENGRMDPSISLAGLPAGIYMVKMADVAGNTGVKQFVKQ